MAWSPMPMPGNSGCPKQSCVHSLGIVPCSSQLALRVQMHELCICPMLVLAQCLYYPQDPQDPVFDLMCVPTVMHAMKVQSK